MSNSLTGDSTSWSQDTPMQTKIYVDGFRIDTIELPTEHGDIRVAAMTAKVRELLDEEGKIVNEVHAVPEINPKFIMITTEI